MAVRILFLILSMARIVNLVIALVGLVMGVNLHQKYGKQILNFFAIFILFVIALYVIFAIIGLI